MVFACEQAMHVPVHAVSQQYPSTQNPEMQFELNVHREPLGCGVAN